MKGIEKALIDAIHEISLGAKGEVQLALPDDVIVNGDAVPVPPVANLDLPVLDRALQAARAGELAWLGWKVVTDAQACLQGKGEGPYPDGSANEHSFVFVANDAREIVCSHEYSSRDRFQMLDVTRGPAMHYDQFEGVTWGSAALFDSMRLVLFGAGEVSRHVARYAADVGFEVEVVDDAPAFLSEDRFPDAKRVLCGFGRLGCVPLGPDDFACVLTRNHEHDVEALTYALSTPASYVGLIGHVDKIAGNLDALARAGIDRREFDRVHAPIGLKCGARTPAEIAVSITAELIQERARRWKKGA